MNAEAARFMNTRWRTEREPSPVMQEAFEEVMQHGYLSHENHERVMEELWERVPVHHKTDFKDPDNGLASVAERQEDCVLFRTTTKLWQQQPFGVLYGDIHDMVNGEWTAVIDDVYPRSADVAASVLPQEHIAMKIVPLPIHLTKFVGEHGYQPYSETTHSDLSTESVGRVLDVLRDLVAIERDRLLGYSQDELHTDPRTVLEEAGEVLELLGEDPKDVIWADDREKLDLEAP